MNLGGCQLGAYYAREQEDMAQVNTDIHAAILRRVRAIPPGYVRTYGDVSPGAPRLAGYVLSQTEAHEAPWHRVVRADGTLAKGARQRRLLEAESVPFRGERVVLSRARIDDLDAL
jgi:alkylated DNA nucleotide flippase Atl1